MAMAMVVATPMTAKCISCELLFMFVSPGRTHSLMKLLEKVLLIRHYTQNIDNLKVAARISKKLLVHAHGTCSSGRCNQKKYRCIHAIKGSHQALLKGQVPRCKG